MKNGGKKCYNFVQYIYIYIYIYIYNICVCVYSKRKLNYTKLEIQM